MYTIFALLTAIAGLNSFVQAQTFQRLGTCPTFGCVFPPDQVDFLPGQFFDIRIEIHAPVNGSEATNGSSTTPNQDFTLTIAKDGQVAQDVTEYFKVSNPEIETWNFTWYEDLFAVDAGTPSLVNVASKAYRKVALKEPGTYCATLTYNNGETTKAEWLVRDYSPPRRAKNVLLFIGDGMTTNMITAARLMAHKTVNGRYQSNLQLDKFPLLGHQMTHSIDSFITDSANSATALYSGHKATVNGLNVYTDSSPSDFDDPKFETVAEMFRRSNGGGVGIVSTAFIADATPAGHVAHTPNRGQYAAIVDSYLNGQRNYSWVDWDGPDVLFGGGAEQFYVDQATGVKNSSTYQGLDYYEEFAKAGYSVSLNNTALQNAPNDQRALGIFTVFNLPVWLDRNIYTDNLRRQNNSANGQGADATDIPGLREMTLKAIDILTERHPDEGWFMMSEAASVDKQMHTLDYDRALGDLLELDDTVQATIKHLAELGELNDTLILVTADHGHGFDVAGSVDTKYLAAQDDDRSKRDAIGFYQNSGLSQYVNPDAEKQPSTYNGTDKNSPVFYTNGTYFPATWDPRYTLFEGIAANPDHRENYRLHKEGPRTPAVELVKGSSDYYANPKDAVDGITINGTLPVAEAQGVHSLTDVPVYAMGPCQELFSGTYGNIDVFFNIASCLGLGQAPKPAGYGAPPS